MNCLPLSVITEVIAPQLFSNNSKNSIAASDVADGTSAAYENRVNKSVATIRYLLPFVVTGKGPAKSKPTISNEMEIPENFLGCWQSREGIRNMIEFAFDVLNFKIKILYFQHQPQ